MYANVRSLTISDVLVPKAGVWRDAALVVCGSLLTALAAQVSIPLYGEGVVHPFSAAISAVYGALGVPLPNTPVPITGQTFAVLLIGALLGSKLGLLALLAYLAEGLAGLPVFALAKNAWSPSAGGLPWIIGPTAGYLIALPVAAYLVGLLAERGWDRRPALTVIAMLAGDAIIFFLGMVWLARYVGSSNVWAMGLLPFIPGDILKIALAALLLPTGWAMLRRAKLL